MAVEVHIYYIDLIDVQSLSTSILSILFWIPDKYNQHTSTAIHTQMYEAYPVVVLSDLPRYSLMLTRGSLPIPI